MRIEAHRKPCPEKWVPKVGETVWLPTSNQFLSIPHDGVIVHTRSVANGYWCLVKMLKYGRRAIYWRKPFHHTDLRPKHHDIP